MRTAPANLLLLKILFGLVTAFKAATGFAKSTLRFADETARIQAVLPYAKPSICGPSGGSQRMWMCVEGPSQNSETLRERRQRRLGAIAATSERPTGSPRAHPFQPSFSGWSHVQ